MPNPKLITSKNCYITVIKWTIIVLEVTATLHPAATHQETRFPGRWRGLFIVYDSERSKRNHRPAALPDGHCPSLVFESRFESGNLRQARRTYVHGYELFKIVVFNLHLNASVQMM